MNNRDKRPLIADVSPLVAPGKSSRLNEMRNRALARGEPAAQQPPSLPNGSGENANPALALVCGLIDRRLSEVLATLPAGKQRRLFKIRFGVGLEEIKTLPLKQALAKLEITHPELVNPRPAMKKALELTYNGDAVL